MELKTVTQPLVRPSSFHYDVKAGKPPAERKRIEWVPITWGRSHKGKLTFSVQFFIKFKDPPRVFRGHRVIPYFVTLFLFLPVCFQEHKAFGTLTPDHIVIVVNGNDPGSRSVGQHYATRRGVPQDHILPLHLPHYETISRPDYQELLVQPLQDLLKARKLASKTRVLVTTYGVPLRVQGPSPSREEAEWKKDAEGWQKAAQKFLEDLNLEINQVMDQPTQGNPPPTTHRKKETVGRNT